MAVEKFEAHPGLSARADQPLIGVPCDEEGGIVVRYYTDEGEADRELDRTSIEQALAVIGAWEDIDTPDALERLERIRGDDRAGGRRSPSY